MQCPNPEWLKRGKALKTYRMTPYRSLGEVAAILDIDLVAYSRMERGLEDPEPAERALWKVSGAAGAEARREWLNDLTRKQEATNGDADE